MLRVKFWFFPRTVPSNEGFFLEYSTDGGLRWIQREKFVRRSGLNNENFYEGEVAIDSSRMDTIKLRFRCETTSQNHMFFIDEIELKGCISSNSNNCRDPHLQEEVGDGG